MEPIRVLAIDDNDDILRDYRKTLSPKTHRSELEDLEVELFGNSAPDPGAAQSIDCVIETASQGFDGVELVRMAISEGNPFDVVFVDMRMPPGWDGLRTIQEIWKLHPEQFVVLCTAYSDYSIEELHHILGRKPNFLILRKPFSPDEIVQMVLSVLGRESDDTRRHRSLSYELSSALAFGNLHLAFQPIIDLKTMAPKGFEALCRWTKNDGTEVPPDIFIRVAEDFGLIKDVGTFVAAEACRSAAILNTEFGNELLVTINASVMQLEPNFLGEILDMVTKNSLQPEQIGVEVTESRVVHDGSQCFETLSALQAEGIQILIDDFGTGFSSLHTLARMPFDVIKIDRSFCRRMVTDPATAIIMKSIVQMAESLGRTCVAEGVESEREEELLRSIGCHAVQGFRYARPMELHSALEFLKSNECEAA
ncbi:MAG: hypothetical protein HONBIEJF_01581 [Fimbriimonadaceae bacterium]|nr:hypothetical protein [Fimbriimonadaceae bacterium]